MAVFLGIVLSLVIGLVVGAVGIATIFMTNESVRNGWNEMAKSLNDEE